MFFMKIISGYYLRGFLGIIQREIRLITETGVAVATTSRFNSFRQSARVAVATKVGSPACRRFMRWNVGLENP